MADNRFLFSSSKFQFEVLLLYIMYVFACLSASRPLLPTYHRQKCFPRPRLWSAGSDRTQAPLPMRQDSASPHGCRQDTHIPSIVFITLQLPNTVLPFTDPRHWMGALFKCFPFKSNACSVFTPKTLLLNPQSEVDSRRISQEKKAFLKKKKSFHSRAAVQSFIFEVTQGSGVHFNEGQVNCSESLFSFRVSLNSTQQCRCMRILVRINGKLFWFWRSTDAIQSSTTRPPPAPPPPLPF